MYVVSLSCNPCDRNNDNFHIFGIVMPKNVQHFAEQIICRQHGDKDNTASIMHKFRGQVSSLIYNDIHRNFVRFTDIKCDTSRDCMRIFLF